MVYIVGKVYPKRFDFFEYLRQVVFVRLVFCFHNSDRVSVDKHYIIFIVNLKASLVFPYAVKLLAKEIGFAPFKRVKKVFFGKIALISSPRAGVSKMQVLFLNLYVQKNGVKNCYISHPEYGCEYSRMIIYC